MPKSKPLYPLTILLVLAAGMAVASASAQARCRRLPASPVSGTAAPAPSPPIFDAAAPEDAALSISAEPSLKTDGYPPGAGAHSVPARPPAATAIYRVSAGESLKSALGRWSQAAGWELVWDASSDYSLSAAARV